MIYRRLALSAFIAFTISSSLVKAADVYLPEKETYEKNETLLKAVIRIEMNRFTCTAARVADRVLLTARHCTTNLTKGVPHAIRINQNDFTVVDFIQQKQLATDKDSSATDMALILVDQSLGSIPMMALPSKQTQFNSNEFIVSGYGYVSPQYASDYESINGGRFGAAQGFWSIFKDGQGKSLKSNLEPSFLKHLTSLYPEALVSSIIIECVNVDQTSRSRFESGEMALPASEKCTPLKSAARGQTSSGDSGGPAIMLDKNKNPYLVGVSSKGNHRARVMNNSNYKVDLYGVKAARASTPEEKILLDSITFTVHRDSQYNLTAETDALIKNAPRKFREKIKTTFKDQNFDFVRITTTSQNYGLSVYTSTLTDRNYQFLQNGIKELSKK